MAQPAALGRTVYFEMRKYFFTTDLVKKSLDRAAVQGLSRFGSFVRRRDKSSLRYRKHGKSAPGQPPFVHRQARFTRTKTNKKTGQQTKQELSPLRELTFFAYDMTRRSVVIGPQVFKSRVGAGTIPPVIEYGGVGLFYHRGKLKSGLYKPRPHTNPAFQAELPKLAGFLKGRMK